MKPAMAFRCVDGTSSSAAPIAIAIEFATAEATTEAHSSQLSGSCMKTPTVALNPSRKTASSCIIISPSQTHVKASTPIEAVYACHVLCVSHTAEYV